MVPLEESVKWDYKAYYQDSEEEIPGILNEVKEIECKIEKEEKNIKAFETEMCIQLGIESKRSFEKKFALQIITQKRARKLLMSKGYQRNEATQIAKSIKRRAMYKILVMPDLRK